MTNIYIFWKEATDPPSPWTRLTRANKYLRFNSSTSNHWTDTGASTHNHSNTMSSYSCGGPDFSLGVSSGSAQAMDNHVHDQGSWSISSADNLPPGYALDIIYMDMAEWEAICKFPNGSVVMSNGTLTDAELTRFSSADNKLIYNNTPGSTKGSSTHTHSVSGYTAYVTPGSPGWAYQNSGGVDANAYHRHHISSTTSSSSTTSPKILTTRLYYTLQETSKALAGVVVFVDGSVGSNWNILTGWANANLASGNSDPTLSGSDSHTQTISTTSDKYDTQGPIVDTGEGNPSCVDWHAHSISATLTSTSIVPESKYIVPVELLTTLYADRGDSPQMIGMAW